MLKKITLLLFLIIQSNFTFSQNTEWVLTAGDFQSEKGISIGTDSLGFIYISGFFNNDITFGSIVLTASSWSTTNKDMFVAKLDSNGNFLWAISGGGGPFDDRALGMHVTPGGTVYLTGTFWGNITFAGVTANGNGHDTSLMVKIDSNGNCIWAKGFGATPSGNCPWPIYDGDDHSYDVKVDKDDFIYVTGFFSGHSADFDAITLNSPNWGNCQPSGYVAKMNPNGDFIWAKRFDGIKDQRGSRDNRIAIDHFSNVYVIGGFENTGVYGPISLTSNGSWDVFLFKMNKDGDYLWAKNVGSNKSDRGNGIAIDACDNVYITGEYRNPMIFSGANASNGTDTLNHAKKRDIFVAKITTNGDWVWAKRARSKRTDKSYQMSVDENMQVFICGIAGDTMKFNNNIVLHNSDTTISAFVAQLDGSGIGEWVWAKMGGGPTDNDRAGDICEDGGSNIYAVGFYENTANIDGVIHTANGRKDVFVWKLKKDQTVEITPSNCIYIDVQPPGSGSIVMNGITITNFPCLQSLSDSTNQTFDAVAGFGYQFVNWDWNIHSPAPSSTSTNTIVYTYSDDTVIVNFQVTPVDTITYIVQPPGSGTITVDGTGITTFPTTEIYNENTNASLVATPNTGFTFSNWDFTNNTALPNANNSNITVTWLSNDTCIVHFNAIPTYDITYLTYPIGAGNIDIDAVNTTFFPTSYNYYQNTNVSLVANDNPSFTFSHWTTQGNTLLPTTTDDIVNFNVTINDTIVAHYTEVDTLWIITNPPGVATLEVESDIITTSPFMGLYQKGSLLEIKAIPNGSNTFDQWNLNDNNLPDYNASTYFAFLSSDTLVASFNNVLAIENLGADLSSANVYPSVFKEIVTVDIKVEKNTKIVIDLINISGQKIQNLYKGKLKNNDNFSKTFDIKVSKGIYFVRLKTNKTNITFKIVKI